MHVHSRQQASDLNWMLLMSALVIVAVTAVLFTARVLLVIAHQYGTAGWLLIIPGVAWDRWAGGLSDALDLLDTGNAFTTIMNHLIVHTLAITVVMTVTVGIGYILKWSTRPVPYR